MSLITKLPHKIISDRLKKLLILPFTTARYSQKQSELCAQNSPYIIIRPDRDSFGEIIEVMYDSYFRDEPILKTLGVARGPNSVLEEEMVRELSQGLSLVARCKYDGCIVAGAINCGTCPWDPDVMDKFACTLSNQKMRQLFQFWAHVQRVPNLWNLACTSKIFEISHVFTLPEERNKGLATQLIQKSIETGADCGYTCIRIDASSMKTSRICEKIGMKLVYEIPYCTYIGMNDKPVIDPLPPDNAVRTYVVTPHYPKK